MLGRNREPDDSSDRIAADRWELYGHPFSLGPVWPAIVVSVAGLGLAAVAIATEGARWPAAVLAILLIGGGVANVAERRRHRPVMLLAADSLGIEVPPIGRVGWERIISINHVAHRDRPFLQIAVRSPYKLVRMRSKRARWVGHAVVAFNGQPLNIDPDRVPIPLEAVRQALLEHAPPRFRDSGDTESRQ